jgi:hypothetical protein
MRGGHLRLTRIIVAGFLVLSILPLTIYGQLLDVKLRPLEPLLDKKWSGILKAPNGSESIIDLAYESLAEGKIVNPAHG